LEAPPGHKIEISFSTIYFGGSVCNNNGEGIIMHDGDSAMSPVIGQFCPMLQKIKRGTGTAFPEFTPWFLVGFVLLDP
jgi:hypothetical protein